MGFISKTFDMKALAQNLCRKQAAPEQNGGTNAYGQVSVRDLDGYLYQQLFLPIVRHGRIPEANLDFEKISHEDLDTLTEVLDNCTVFDLFHLGDAFTSIPPAVSPTSVFI